MHFGDHILHNLLLLKSKNYRKLYKYFTSSEFSPFSAKIRQFEVLPSANGNPSYCRIAVLPSATSSIVYNLHINWDQLSYVTCLDTFIDLKPRISEE